MPLLLAAALAHADTTVCRQVPYQTDPDARNVLRLTADQPSDVNAGDLVLVLASGKAVGAGRVVPHEDQSQRAELDWLDWDLPERGQLLVIPRDVPDRIAPTLPPCLSRVRRPGPAVPASQPADASGAPTRRDRSDRIRANVVRHKQLAEGGNAQLLELSANVAPTVGIGDRFDLYRGARYVGFAKTVSAGTGTILAETVASFCALPARIGDAAVRRRTPDGRSGPYGHIFRIEPGYVLVTLGEADGLRRGDWLRARSADGSDYRLRVDRAYPDHCGAATQEGTDGRSISPTAWDPVCTTDRPRLTVAVPADAWRPIPAGRDRFAAVRAAVLPAYIRPGDFIVANDRPDRVGVVLIANPDQVHVYAPGVWTCLGVGLPTDDAPADH